MLARMWRQGNPFALLVRMQTCADTLENRMEGPQKVKNQTTPQPSNLTTTYLTKVYKKYDFHNVEVFFSFSMYFLEGFYKK